MGDFSSYETQVQPESVVKYLGAVQWHNHTRKYILGKQHAIHSFGYLNPLRPVCISIVSDAEMEWLYGQPEQNLLSCPALQPQGVVIIVMSKNCKPNPALLDVCQRNDIALVETALSGPQLMEVLLCALPKLVALRDTLYGVFLAVLNTGVLLIGTSGVGKSEVAMDLIQRGHQLIADDAVYVHRNEQNELIGECPETLKNYIEIRGLGIINVQRMFGPSAVIESSSLTLIIKLQDATDSEVRKVDRLSPSLAMQTVLGVEVPCLTLLVAPGRNLSVLVEAAVRDHLLRVSGADSNQDFLHQHDRIMKQSPES